MEARHGELLFKVAAALKEASCSLDKGYPLDLVSIDLRQAQQHLGALLGENTGEAVLENIFKRFCVGK